jgi:hypothetical protein
MKLVYVLYIGLCLLFVLSVPVVAQVTGDYQSNGTGNWNDASKWQRYNGSSWVTAGTAPTGSGTITLRGTDSLSVNVAVTITGTLKSTGGKLGNSATTLTFAGGGMYEHAMDAGKIPSAIWNSGSTCKVTGMATAAPSFPSEVPPT